MRVHGSRKNAYKTSNNDSKRLKFGAPSFVNYLFD